MKLVLAPLWLSFFVMLSGCLSDDNGPSSASAESDFESVLNTENGAQSDHQLAENAAVKNAKLAVTVTPQVEAILLQYPSFPDAESYAVHYRESSAAQVNSDIFYQVSDFQLSTVGVQSFQIWVEAINVNGEVMAQSEKMIVASLVENPQLISENAP